MISEINVRPPVATSRFQRAFQPVAASKQRLTEEMSMPQFDATIKHIKEGVKGFTVAAATKNIEAWEATLEKVEVSGVKTIIKDLESLKKHLHAKEINGEQIRKLIAKLGKETVAIAGKADGKNAEKIKSLGEALSSAAEEHEGAEEKEATK